MKFKKFFVVPVLFVLIILTRSLECRADTFLVTHNIAPLIGSAAGPFSLNFQFNGTAGNTATISNFNFFGGSWTGSPDVFGHTIVDGSGSVILSTSPSGFFNSFAGIFTPGTMLQFFLTITSNSSPTPDQFSFAILDSDGFELPTLGAANEFLSIDVTAPFTIQTFGGSASGAGPVLGAPTISAVSPVPEPAAMVLFGSGLILLATRVRKYGERP